ncbi:type IV pilus assembly protein PilV [Aeromonas sp. RU39B]|uniref:type IV pilus modification protein PilV n=1 Tax=Aeromonas sp. RU39B TaxID=1907416 RepID=UPI000956A26C|nr:type IV pilus modification protein PilV [Aeromonas sp. RU39B]SIR24338.1 type IV pilus assembly protein PilV [Aeromonas sp. RU39B]
MQPCRGFSLLEVTIAAVILSFGLLGLVAMQSSARFAGYEARQRTLATLLASDMLERARLNRLIWREQTDRVWLVDSHIRLERAACAQPDGTQSHCSDSELLQQDLLNWQQSLLGSSVSGAEGALQDPVGCIIRDASNALTVLVLWAGRERIHDGSTQFDETITIPCQIVGNEKTRRQLMLTTRL